MTSTAETITRPQPAPAIITAMQSKEKPRGIIPDKQLSSIGTVATASKATTKPTTSTPRSNEPSTDVPIFLRKTYHMIDTCNPEIACWSEDGETFVVKDPDKFEKTIIPQFFKHSKFTSFVRQLNFYSFRKIKNNDTLRIDPVLEAETANYWRFRHDKFRKGRPDLLTEIKRMNGQRNGGGAGGKSGGTASPGGGVSAVSKPSVEKVVVQEDKAVKNEVLTLKKRIEEMTKNIDELTSMVQKVSLKQEKTDEVIAEQNRSVPDETISASNKRKKLDLPAQDESGDDQILPDGLVTSGGSAGAIGMDLEDDGMMVTGLPPLAPLPAPMPMQREASSGVASVQLSDADFVDQLFADFDEPAGIVGESASDLLKLDDDDDSLPPLKMEEEEPSQQQQGHGGNRPDPVLMEKLGDALALLPKAMQEMIVNRLIAAITSGDFPSSTPSMPEIPLSAVARGSKSIIPPTPSVDDDSVMKGSSAEPPLPLAAATLAALLHHYTAQLQKQDGGDLVDPDDHHHHGHHHHHDGKKSKGTSVQKLLPVIPVHA